MAANRRFRIGGTVVFKSDITPAEGVSAASLGVNKGQLGVVTNFEIDPATYGYRNFLVCVGAYGGDATQPAFIPVSDLRTIEPFSIPLPKKEKEKQSPLTKV